MHAASLTCGVYVGFWRGSREGCAWGQQSAPPCKEEEDNHEEGEGKTASQVIVMLFMRDMSYTCVDEDECIGKLTLPWPIVGSIKQHSAHPPPLP